MMKILSITREEPLFRKCCFCIPLRLCLQTWAYIKVVADSIAVSFLVLVIAILYNYDQQAFIKGLTIAHLLILLVTALIVDVGFLVALVVGIFKKSIIILRVFYFYEFYAMTVETVMLAIVAVYLVRENPAVGALLFTFIGIYIILDVCVMLTVKSEMIKLRNKEQYDFSRMRDCPEDGDGDRTGNFIAEQQCVDA